MDSLKEADDNSLYNVGKYIFSQWETVSKYERLVRNIRCVVQSHRTLDCSSPSLQIARRHVHHYENKATLYECVEKLRLPKARTISVVTCDRESDPRCSEYQYASGLMTDLMTDVKAKLEPAAGGSGSIFNFDSGSDSQLYCRDKLILKATHLSDGLCRKTISVSDITGPNSVCIKQDIENLWQSDLRRLSSITDRKLPPGLMLQAQVRGWRSRVSESDSRPFEVRLLFVGSELVAAQCHCLGVPNCKVKASVYFFPTSIDGGENLTWLPYISTY